MAAAEHVEPDVGASAKSLHLTEIHVGFLSANEQADDCGYDRNRYEQYVAEPTQCELELQHDDIDDQLRACVVMRRRFVRLVFGHDRSLGAAR